MILRRLWHLQPGGRLLHFSLLLILVGACITHFAGRQGHVKLRVGEPATGNWTLDSGVSGELPFKLSLVDCGTELHSSGMAARDYYSEVEIDGELYRVSMNRTFDRGGYRLTQASLGDGTSTLNISYDPWGRGVTFASYGLLFLSMVWVLCSSRRLRALARKAMLPALLMLPLLAHAQPKTLQRPLARTYGELYAEYGQRICPVQTVARDFCMKVTGSDAYNGLTAEQVLTGWIYYYDKWKHEPMIKLKSREARELTGKKYVSLSDLFTRDGYLLESLLDGPSPSRDLLTDDEKVSLITSVVTGRFPQIVGADRFEVKQLFEQVGAKVATGHYNDANDRLKELRGLQEREFSDRLPSVQAIGAERLYNAGYYPLLSAIVAFAAAGLAFTRYRRVGFWTGIVLLLYLSFIYTLRWIVGGHMPLASGYETMLTLAWFAVAVALLTTKRMPVMLPLGLTVCGAALLVAMISSHNPAVGPLMPVLESRLLSVHVMLVMCSYALFAIITLNSGLALAGRGATDISRLLLYPALFLLGAGIFTGAIWADQSWGRYWGWDPKETWALITFLIYAVTFHDRSIPALRSNRFLNLYLIFSFLSVLMTYFGVNLFMGGLHSYGA